MCISKNLIQIAEVDMQVNNFTENIRMTSGLIYYVIYILFKYFFFKFLMYCLFVVVVSAEWINSPA